ncbi:T9SS type A sorting domain-containing protein [Flavobacterium pectinovorum]|uniref:T9SS type A sorting domain-containing protein n=1 Tax=Flavobacterium pectinovorum TaxID=29533 RepID=UPI001FAB61BF|nr:T9SS type A sorting domain-containing protein [Flavobacterium pectinovorum]MCI9845285.1 T9SS type A sorting domain-containing protein [Flavobacterium pectinovorum]
MKKTLLSLLFLFTNFFYAQVSDIEQCSGNTFDLTSKKTLLIGNLNPAETIVTYHLSLEDATNNTNAISNPTNYSSNSDSKTIYARIDNKGAITTNYFNLILKKSSPFILVADITPTSCMNNKGTITVQGNGGKAPYIYSINGGTFSTNNVFKDLVPGIHTIYAKDASGCSISTVSVSITAYTPIKIIPLTVSPNCNGDSTGQIHLPNTTGGNAPYTYTLRNYTTGELTKNPFYGNIFYNVAAGRYIVEATDATGCKEITFVEMTQPAPLFAAVAIENTNSVKITATGGSGSYTYAISPKLNQFFSYGTFTNLEPGYYTSIIQDLTGCFLYYAFVINPPSPLINGKNAINFDFTPGQTLEDIVVDGQNIKWYSSQNSTRKTSKAAETTLPLITVLVDGVTYYASQTINNVESTQRLAVTAKSNGALSNEDFVLPNFKFYPNPVKNKLALSNTANIDEVELLAVSGKSVLVKKINDIHSEIDLSNISTGIYFLKVKSEEKTKTIKIVKE